MAKSPDDIRNSLGKAASSGATTRGASVGASQNIVVRTEMPAFESVEEFRSSPPLADLTVFSIVGLGLWQYRASVGAGEYDDGSSVLKYAAVDVAQNGRAYQLARSISNEVSRPVVAATISTARPVASGAAFVDGGANPLSYAMESSFVLEGTRLHNWYRDTRDSKIYYAYSDDRESNVWTLGNGGMAISDTNADLVGTEMPYVQKVGSTYYMIANKQYNLRLLSSTDKVTWTFADGGTPVLAKSANAADWNYYLFNPAFCVVGNEWHLLVEAKSSVSLFRTHYSHATFTNGTVNFQANAVATPVLSGTTGNPFLIHVPDRSALLAVYGDLTSGTWVLRAVTALLSADLTLAASWVAAPGFGLHKSGVHLADPTLVFSDGTVKSWKCLLGYNYAQERGYQAYCQMSLNELFDAIKDPATQMPSRVVGTVETDAVEFGHDSQIRLSRNTLGSVAYKTASGLLEMIKNETPNNAIQLRVNAGDFLIHTGATPGVLGTPACIVQSTGFFGVAVTSPGARFHVRQSGGANQLVARFDNNGGNAFVELLGGTTACVQFWTTGAGDFAIQTAATPGTVGTQRFYIAATGEIRIGGTGSPHASALLDIQSTTKGVKFPSMTTTQKNAIATPGPGLVVYDSTTNKLCCYNGTAWTDLF